MSVGVDEGPGPNLELGVAGIAGVLPADEQPGELGWLEIGSAPPGAAQREIAEPRRSLFDQGPGNAAAGEAAPIGISRSARAFGPKWRHRFLRLRRPRLPLSE
jgi:hypothetical protein